MKELFSFGQCLKSILDHRELSVLESSKLLGMKSATSLSRIIHDEVNVKTLEKIYPRLEETFSLNQQERYQLKRGLMISRMGVEQYLGYKSMWQLIFQQSSREETKNAVIHPVGNVSIPKLESMQRLTEFLLGCSRTEMLIAGCCSPEIIGAFRLLAEKGKNISITHFLPFQERDMQQLIGSIAAITPFLPYSRYTAYIPEGSAQPEIFALYARNEILIDSIDQDGKRRMHHLVQVEKAKMQMIEYQTQEPFQFHRQLFLQHQMHLKPIKMVFPQAVCPEDYIKYTEYYRNVEENKAIYSIKPDLPFNFIHPDLLVTAVTEGFTDNSFVSKGELESLVARLYQIHLQRWKNIYEKKKVTHIVFSIKEMQEFARTGIQTDHFFAIRAFTPHERRQILQHIRQQMAENPYFNVYFSRDEKLPFQFEVTAYEEYGVQLTYAHTGYNFSAGHSEALINQKDFFRIFNSFYQSELLQAHVLSPRENLAIMDQLIASIPGKK